jgi:uncharacterized protein YeaO (DUF488 family)
MIRIKRVFESPNEKDGHRFLVDRLWPRGIRKEQAQVEGWYKETAPSNELRVWFKHDPAKWQEFKKRYFLELEKNPNTWTPLLEAALSEDITLVYAAKDEKNNNAVVLRDFLNLKLKNG